MAHAHVTSRDALFSLSPLVRAEGRPMRLGTDSQRGIK